MKQRLFKVIALCLVLAFCVTLPKNEGNAEEMYAYYLTFNQIYQYEITREQYESIRGSWNELTAEGVLEIARQIVPEEKIPANLTNIGIRAVPRDTTVGELPTYIEKDETETTDTNSDFLISQGVLVEYLGKDEVVQIPDTVTTVYQGAFNQNPSVKKVIVPESVKYISSLAFYKCPNLCYVVFAGKANTVGEKMIYQCDSLVNLVAPKNSKEFNYATKNAIPVFTSGKITLGESKKIYLLTGDKENLHLYNAMTNVTWKSSNPKVASISAKGVLRCKKTGKVKIRAVSGGKTYCLQVCIQTKSEDKRVKQVIKTVIRKGMSTKEKIKAVHNWMIRNVKYDYQNYLHGTVPKVSHTAKGALVRGTAVCDGYSKAFMKIMKQLKIPCKMITGFSEGGGHAWNLVKVNGKWLHVDVTFDDPIVNGSNTNKTPRYTYFLKTSAQMRKDHVW